MASTWTVACAQPTDARGDEQTPAPRYGHGAAIRDEIMTITHGYYFDHERCKPMFLDDTWEYHTIQPREYGDDISRERMYLIGAM